MNTPKLLMSLACLCFSLATFSQTPVTKKIDVNRDIDIVKVYEQYVEDGYGSSSIYKDLAIAYYFKSEYLSAKKYFERLFEIEKPSDEIILFRYKQTLRALDLLTEDNIYLNPVRVTSN